MSSLSDPAFLGILPGLSSRGSALLQKCFSCAFHHLPFRRPERSRSWHWCCYFEDFNGFFCKQHESIVWPMFIIIANRRSNCPATTLPRLNWWNTTSYLQIAPWLSWLAVLFRGPALCVSFFLRYRNQFDMKFSVSLCNLLIRFAWIFLKKNAIVYSYILGFDSDV